MEHPHKSLVATRHNLCINSHPRHLATSRVILTLNINVMVHQRTTGLGPASLGLAGLGPAGLGPAGLGPAGI